MSDISKNLGLVTQNIEKASLEAHRTPREVTLVAVSKTHPTEAVEQAIQAGQRVFGENRVQEALAKFPSLKQAHPDLELHLIGPLQTNKVSDAVELFDVIETLDRPKLAQAIAQEATKQGRCPRLYIEVNTGAEPQKAGIALHEVEAFLSYCQNDLSLKIEGLMCIPPVDQDPAPHFNKLHELAHRLNLPAISMGMSADYEIAITHGAIHVRVGTAIFGHREPAPSQ